MESNDKRRLDGIFDQSGNPLDTCDLTKGRLVDQTKTISHAAIEGIEEQGHWETIAEYPNGGKDIEWIVEAAGVEPMPAWDEEVIYSAFVPYTQEELAEMEQIRNQPTAEERIKELERTIEILLKGELPDEAV